MRDPTDHTTLPTKQQPVPRVLLTEEELRQFQELALREYGVTLTDDQAYEQAIALLILFETLLEKHLAFGRQNDTITEG